MNQNELKTLREQAQENIRCALDGAPEEMLDAACQAVVDAFKPLIPEEQPRVRIMYSETATIPTGSDYLVDLITKEIGGMVEGDGMVVVDTELLNAWLFNNKIPANDHVHRLYEFLINVSNKLEDDEKEPEYIMFTN